MLTCLSKQAVNAILFQSGKANERPDAGNLLEGNEILVGEEVIDRFGKYPDICEMCDVDQPVYWADLLTKPLLKKRRELSLLNFLSSHL